MIIEQIEVTWMSVFSYLLVDDTTREGVLIDPAGDFDRIFQKVDEHRARITYVINTHGHWDHASGNEHVMNRTGARLVIHENDAPMLRRVSTRVLSRVLGGKGSPAPYLTVKDGDTISAGGLRLKVLHTPGHTEGSICLHIDGNLFTGDTLFTEGMGRTDFSGGSYEKIMESITKKILALPDTTKIWPGHNYGRFPVSTVREQKRYYPQ